MNAYTVFIKVDDQQRVTAINSSAFLTDTAGWIKLDEGSGDRFHHAQGNYLEKPLMDDDGIYQYKFVDGAVCERTEAEKMADRQPEAETPSPAPSDIENRLKTAETGITELSETLDMILSGVTEDE